MQHQELTLQDPPLCKEHARGWALQNSSKNYFHLIWLFICLLSYLSVCFLNVTFVLAFFSFSLLPPYPSLQLLFSSLANTVI